MQAHISLLLVIFLTACAATAPPSEESGFHGVILNNSWREPLPAGIDFDASQFLEARLDYAASTDYDPLYFGQPDRLALLRAARSGKWKKVSRLAVEWLNRCPIDSEAHLYAAKAAREAGDGRLALAHLYAFHGLLQSLLASGTGESEQQAIKVVSAIEEYDVIRILGVELLRQGSYRRGYDVMTVKLGDDQRTLYFDISTVLAAMHRMFDPAPSNLPREDSRSGPSASENPAAAGQRPALLVDLER